MKIELPESRWGEIMSAKGREVGVTVHLIIWTPLTSKLLIVKNKVEEKHFPGQKPILKREGWGVPTGKVHLEQGESLYEAALRELEEETGLMGEKEIFIREKPLFVFESANGHFNVIMGGFALSQRVAWKELKEIKDPDRKVTHSAWADVTSEIKFSEIQKSYLFREEPFYTSHHDIIVRACELNVYENVPTAILELV